MTSAAARLEAVINQWDDERRAKDVHTLVLWIKKAIDELGEAEAFLDEGDAPNDLVIEDAFDLVSNSEMDEDEQRQVLDTLSGCKRIRNVLRDMTSIIDPRSYGGVGVEPWRPGTDAVQAAIERLGDEP